MADFIRGFSAGAAVGNMMVLRKERMMELRSEEALRAVRERYLAAEADSLSYKIDTERAAKEKLVGDLKKSDEMYHLLTETTPATPAMARETVDNWLTANNPAAAKLVFGARAEQALATERAARAEQVGKPTPADLIRDRHYRATEEQDLSLKTRSSDLRKRELDLREKNIDRLAKKYSLSPADSAELKRISKRIEALQDKLDDTATLPEETGIGPWKKRNPKRLKMELEIAALEGKARRLDDMAKKAADEESGALGAPAAPGAPKAAVPGGPKPKAPAGEVLVLSKDGKLGSVPKEDVEAALNEGYKLYDEESGAGEPDDEGDEGEE